MAWHFPPEAGYSVGLADPEVNRLTGTHATFDRSELEIWLATRREHDDRADWAAVSAADGAFLGEAVLNEFDPDNASAARLRCRSVARAGRQPRKRNVHRRARFSP